MVKKLIECGLAWTVFLSTTIQVITVVKICCETIDLFMHMKKFSREFKWFLKGRLHDRAKMARIRQKLERF